MGTRKSTPDRRRPTRAPLSRRDEEVEVDLRAAGLPDGSYDARRGSTFAAALSLVLHAALAGGGAWVVAHSLSHEEPAKETHADPLPPPGDPNAPFVVDLPAIESIELPPAGAPTAEKSDPPGPTPPPLAAVGAQTPRIDDETPGKGGDSTTLAAARNLAPHAEEDTVAANLRDTVGDDQDNLLDTSKDRKSFVDRRYALEPMEASFVATGSGTWAERRPVAPVTATLGAPSKGIGSIAGATSIGTGAPTPGVGVSATLGGPTLGVAATTPKAGAAYGERVGAISMSGADVEKARPDVDKGKPSITSNDKGVAQGDKDADETVNALKGLIDTTTFGAAQAGDGKGGTGGGGSPGAGGTAGAGSKSAALGSAVGSADGLREHLRLTYIHALQQRISGIVAGAFPKADALELRSGTVIIDLVIGKPGTLIDVVVVRPSGFPVFDQNVVSRLHAAGAFEPVPDLLGAGPIHVAVPILGGWSLD